LNQPIRVVVDPGFVAELTLRRDEMFGIRRAVEAWIDELAGRMDVSLRLAGVCGDDAVFRSAVAVQYAARRFPRVAADPAVRFPPGIGRLTRTVVGRYVAGRVELRVGSGVRAAMAVIKRAAAPTSLAGRADVFHSTFLPLPRADWGRPVGRLLTIYDLLPLTSPEQYSPGQTAITRAFLDSLRPDRDWAICISEHVRQEVSRVRGMDPERIFVSPLGVDRAFRRADSDRQRAVRATYGIPPDVPFMLNLASAQPRKNLARLIDAFATHLGRRPESLLRLVLAGPRVAEHDRLTADRLGADGVGRRVADRIHFTGLVAEDDLPALLSAATVFAFPSLAEGFGLPVLEAMACGTPVVTSNTTSLPEVVGSAGLMVDPMSVEALVDAIEQVIDRPDLAGRLAEAGPARAAGFTWAGSTDRLVDAYRRIAETVLAECRTGAEPGRT
jgi:glycosyltransferase involved in cell wall biosynthesis